MQIVQEKKLFRNVQNSTICLGIEIDTVGDWGCPWTRTPFLPISPIYHNHKYYLRFSKPCSPFKPRIITNYLANTPSPISYILPSISIFAINFVNIAKELYDTLYDSCNIQTHRYLLNDSIIQFPSITGWRKSKRNYYNVRSKQDLVGVPEMNENYRRESRKWS